MTRSRHTSNSKHAPACILGKKVLYLLLTPLLEPPAKEPTVAVDIRVMCTKSCRAMGVMFYALSCESNMRTDTGKKVIYMSASWMSCHAWGVRALLY